MSSSQTLGRCCAIALLTTIAAGSAQAVDVTRGAVAVMSTMGQFSNALATNNLINQSGLSSPYVSGTTAFDAYIASVSHDSTASQATWYSPANATTGYLTFDLGAAYAIDGLAVFGLGSTDNARVTGINVYADNDSDPTNGTTGLLSSSGAFSTPQGPGSAVVANVFSFSSSATTRYVSLQVLTHGAGAYAGMGEVVFSQVAAVPEPGTWALMALGLAGVGGLARRRKA